MPAHSWRSATTFVETNSSLLLSLLFVLLPLVSDGVAITRPITAPRDINDAATNNW